MIDIRGSLLVVLSSLFGGTFFSRTLSVQYPRITGAIYGIPTYYIIIAVVLIIISSIVYSIKRALRSSVRRGVEKSIFDSITNQSNSSQQQTPLQQKPCNE